MHSTMIQRLSAVVLASACVAILAACPARARVWVIEGSTIAHLRFGVEGHRRRDAAYLRRFEVVECAERARTIRSGPGTRWSDEEVAVWAILSTGLREGVRELTYGQPASSEFVHVVAPTPLRPGGCYLAKLTADPGTGSTMFRVRDDGAVTELSAREERALYTRWHAEAKRCEAYVRTEVPAPSGRARAVVFHRDCGPVLGFPTQVSLLTSDTRVGESETVFVADVERRLGPSPGERPAVAAYWRGPDTVIIRHHADVRVVRADTLHGRIAVRYVRDSLP